jgi:D-beta-D-heptose 7-phosphate kinase/D-beta-D-heptose 1-phosphate adenosyltransferase
MGRLVSVTQAQGIRQRLRKQGKTVVFTNGIFDLLHVGHVRYLQAARKLGHTLFVGLNSDSSAQKLRGAGRPLVVQAERAEVLCALACVDYVVVFDEPTAERLVETLQPDVYAKGGDYVKARSASGEKGKALPEAPVVESYGGRVVILPYTGGHSTTHIVQRLLDEGERHPGG